MTILAEGVRRGMENAPTDVVAGESAFLMVTIWETVPGFAFVLQLFAHLLGPARTGAISRRP